MTALRRALRPVALPLLVARRDRRLARGATCVQVRHLPRLERRRPSGGAADGVRALDLVHRQCAVGPRVPGTAAHRAARDLLLGLLREVTDDVAVQDWVQRVERGAGAGTTVGMSNLLGRVRGTRGQGPPLLLATHWDTRPVADADPDPLRRHQPPPGANDGASGAAVLLEAARALSAAPVARDVVVALLDGEDLGEHCYGSRVLAPRLGRGDLRGWRPDAAVVVDMVGRPGLRCVTELGSVERHPGLWAQLDGAARAAGVGGLLGGPVRRIGDDHVPLSRARVPAVLLLGDDDPARHTTADTPDRISPDSLAAVATLLLAWVGRA